MALDKPWRQQQCGRRLAQHAIVGMRPAGVEAISIWTSGDAFHAPARALYESLGFVPFPKRDLY